ncbi:MAG: bifunctional N(6)-L-threonylcarbamoyladenine synthase/serine/threonine protein kinase [Candidatus Diapherotrites archaeon]|nr:bifunctional N(6)-L-threonylcarbamoyladenine synthase/serine/threonine protein kinase [Candidatus Diapherotrites archaeon]
MICLGIEGTAHTLGLSLVDDKGNILCEKKKTYTTKTGGIHPREAAQMISASFGDLLNSLFEGSKASRNRIDAVAFSQGPGLGPCLETTAVASRAISVLLDVPLIGVNHCVAHIEIANLLCGMSDSVVVYVSGGNTQIISFEDKKYRVLGETLDVGLGNAVDSFARDLGFGHPGFPKVSALAEKGKRFIELPYTVKGMDFVFSGLATEALKQAAKKENTLEDVCFSLEETAFCMLAEAAERALSHTGKTELLLTGGVGRSKRLREKLSVMAKERGCRFAVPPDFTLGDNGAMIAWTGILALKSGFQTPIKESQPISNWRTDAVEVPWRS